MIVKKALLFFLCFFSISLASISTTADSPALLKTTNTTKKATSWSSLYNDLNLAAVGLQRTAFTYAIQGLQKMAGAHPVLSIVDLSQPSTQKRLYIIDLLHRKLLFQTYVSHGVNSGQLMANQFSNAESSFQSSLGFYQTLETYQGKHGLSLKLKGLEKGFNDNAFSRAIVLHGADYVSENFIHQTGRLGRSQGCPAVSNDLSEIIIQTVKGGSCLFIYFPDPNYLKKSTYIAGSGTGA